MHAKEGAFFIDGPLAPLHWLLNLKVTFEPVLVCVGVALSIHWPTFCVVALWSMF